MIQITVSKKDQLLTRIVVGCAEQALPIVAALHRDHWDTKVETIWAPPDRDEDEKNRATRLIGKLFGH